MVEELGGFEVVDREVSVGLIKREGLEVATVGAFGMLGGEVATGVGEPAPVCGGEVAKNIKININNSSS